MTHATALCRRLLAIAVGTPVARCPRTDPDGRSLALSADDVRSLFEGFIGTTPQCDSSETYMRAVWPKPSPAVLRLTFAAGISEVSRFSCMKFLGVPGVFDYAGLNRDSRYRPCSCCLPRMLTASASGLYVFAAQ